MSYSYRLNDVDGSRSTETAIANIKACTIKENMAQQVILADLKARYPDKAIELTDNGIDNSGTFISNDSNVTADPDWHINIDGKSVLAEALVHSSKFPTVTILERKLKRAVNNNSLIIVIREDYWLRFKPSQCKYFLENLEMESDHRKMGGKPALIIKSHQQLNAYIAFKKIDKFEYTEPAKDLINNLVSQLFDDNHSS